MSKKRIATIVILTLFLFVASGSIKTDAEEMIALSGYKRQFSGFLIDNQYSNLVILENTYEQDDITNQKIRISVREEDKNLVYFLWFLDVDAFNKITIYVSNNQNKSSNQEGEFVFEEAYFEGKPLEIERLPEALTQSSSRNFISKDYFDNVISKPYWLEVNQLASTPFTWEIGIDDEMLFTITTGEYYSKLIFSSGQREFLVPITGIYAVGSWEHLPTYFVVGEDGYIKYLRKTSQEDWSSMFTWGYGFFPNVHCFGITYCAWEGSRSHFIEPLYFVDGNVHHQQPNKHP